ncbi:MAG: acetate/propionate family kinase [Pseudomonadota bacterium]
MGIVLTFNAGSSSLKFSGFKRTEGDPSRLFKGHFDAGKAPDSLTIELSTGEDFALGLEQSGDLSSAFETLLRWSSQHQSAGNIDAIGHRIVHGGLTYTNPIVLDDASLSELAKLEPLAPLHQPFNLKGVRLARRAFPGVPQIGCFDTAFHRRHPFVNDTFGLPYRFFDEGVRRYGFHGLSYTSISEALGRRDPKFAKAKVIVAHLGSGASMCAIREGQSIGSTMGFSALDGLPMGTRCGQLDPGVLIYLMETHGLDRAELTDLLYRESGLLGISGISNDMRVLLESDRPRAQDAIDYFVFRIRREIGAMTAVLGGLDALVFTGGIGENSAVVRERICADFGWLGLSIDPSKNDQHADVVSPDGSQVEVMVLPTDEEAVIAHAAIDLAEG